MKFGLRNHVCTLTGKRSRPDTLFLPSSKHSTRMNLVRHFSEPCSQCERLPLVMVDDLSKTDACWPTRFRQCNSPQFCTAQIAYKQFRICRQPGRIRKCAAAEEYQASKVLAIKLGADRTTDLHSKNFMICSLRHGEASIC